MPIVFDPADKRIILDSTSVTATELYSRWCDWLTLSDNAKYLPAFRAVGGDDLGGGLLIPPYYFLLNGWRVRPMEANHNLTITGNLFVDGGGVPVVNTLGTFQVNVNYTVPVQAQGISTGGGSGPTAPQIAVEVWGYETRTLTAGNAGAFSTPLPYKGSTTTSAADPGTGRVRWNNATQSAATELYIDTITDDGLDITNYIAAIPAGSTVVIQDKDNAAVSQKWLIESITNNGGWATIGVALMAAQGGNIANNHPVVLVFNNAIVATAPTAIQIADTVWSKALETLTAEEMMRIMLAALAGKRQGLGTGTEQYMAQDGTTPRITLTPDQYGNGTPTIDGTA